MWKPLRRSAWDPRVLKGGDKKNTLIQHSGELQEPNLMQHNKELIMQNLGNSRLILISLIRTEMMMMTTTLKVMDFLLYILQKSSPLQPGRQSFFNTVEPHHSGPGVSRRVEVLHFLSSNPKHGFENTQIMIIM